MLIFTVVILNSDTWSFSLSADDFICEISIGNRHKLEVSCLCV